MSVCIIKPGDGTIPALSLYEDMRFQIAGYSVKNNCFTGMHTHDFYEFLYVEKGQIQHNINGRSTVAYERELYFILPDDEHQVIMSDDHPSVFYNLAFPADVFERIQKQYNKISYQPVTKIPQGKHQTILNWFTEMATAENSDFAIDRILLNLAHITAELNYQPTEQVTPDWILSACERVKEPTLFKLDTKAFIKSTNRCHEHVIRELKKYIGLTPSQLLNKARMEYAGKELIMTDKEIFDIALDTGFENLNYFYQKFKEHYGLSPAKYRRHKNFKSPLHGGDAKGSRRG